MIQTFVLSLPSTNNEAHDYTTAFFGLFGTLLGSLISYLATSRIETRRAKLTSQLQENEIENRRTAELKTLQRSVLMETQTLYIKWIRALYLILHEDEATIAKHGKLGITPESHNLSDNFYQANIEFRVVVSRINNDNLRKSMGALLDRAATAMLNPLKLADGASQNLAQIKKMHTHLVDDAIKVMSDLDTEVTRFFEH